MIIIPEVEEEVGETPPVVPLSPIVDPPEEDETITSCSSCTHQIK